jgi:hypothetical protein
VNERLEWWLTSHRGLEGLKKDWPLIILGPALSLAYRWSGGHRWWFALLLMSLPMLIKLAVAVCVVGWRKAIIPQNERVRIFLPRVK